MEALLSNVSSTTRSMAINGKGSAMTVLVDATSLGGGAVTVEVSIDRANWVPISLGGTEIGKYLANGAYTVPPIPTTAWVSVLFTEFGAAPDNVNVYVG